jgi:hypothetical protein
MLLGGIDCVGARFEVVVALGRVVVPTVEGFQ